MRRFQRFAPVLLVLLSALFVMGQEGQEGEAAQPAGGQLDALFVEAVADNDMYEIRSSEVVLELGGDDQEVAAFAQRMIDDHTASSQRLAELAAGVNAQLPQEMSPDNQFKVEQLRALDGDQAVQTYLLQQEMAHVDAIALFTAQAELGQNEELRAFAQETLPLLQEHLDMVRSLREAGGG